ncbi:MAG: glycosyltransferase [Chitinivibrionales bacterium]|nr:glycosyltransferase [Chitinivibrionales bacterium]
MFELARAVSKEGRNVLVYFLDKEFGPGKQFFDKIKASETQQFKIKSKNTFATGGEYKYSSFKPAEEITTSINQAYKAVKLLFYVLSSLKFLFAELCILLKTKPAVVIVRPDHVISFPISCALLRIPFIIDNDGIAEEFDWFNNIPTHLVRPFVTWRTRMADAVLVISEECRKYWIDHKVKENRLFMCPNAADPDEFKPAPEEFRSKNRKKLSIGNKDIVVAYSGTQAGWHGINTLIAAIPDVLNFYYDTFFLIIGKGPDKNSGEYLKLPALIRKNKICATGQVAHSEMAHFIDLADIVIMPYPTMPIFYFSPMKMFEALALDKIIIAPRLGQIKEICSELPSAFLYDPEKPFIDEIKSALSEAIAFLNSHTSANFSRDILVKNHTWQHRGRAILDACGFVSGMEKK